MVLRTVLLNGAAIKKEALFLDSDLINRFQIMRFNGDWDFISSFETTNKNGALVFIFWGDGEIQF